MWMLEGVQRHEAVIFFLLTIKIDFSLTSLLSRNSVFNSVFMPKKDAVQQFSGLVTLEQLVQMNFLRKLHT